MFNIINDVVHLNGGNFSLIEGFSSISNLSTFMETYLGEEIESFFSKQWLLFFKDKVSKSLNLDMQIDWDKEYLSAKKLSITAKV